LALLHCCTSALLLLLLLQLEQRIAANIEVARELVAQKKKERALLALKKKRLSEHQLASIQAYLMNVEDMVRWLAGACQTNSRVGRKAGRMVWSENVFSVVHERGGHGALPCTNAGVLSGLSRVAVRTCVISSASCQVH
jgi:hypothetical protein